MPPTVGVFHELWTDADFLWNQCEAPRGTARTTHGDIQLLSQARAADLALVLNFPVWRGYKRQQLGWRRHLLKWNRDKLHAHRVQLGFEWLCRDPSSTWTLIYEPPEYVSDDWYAIAKKYSARVYGPDPRATHPIVLPAMWTFEDDLHALRHMPPPEKSVPLVGINAGTPAGKKLIPGHIKRLEFFAALRRAGVDAALYGRGLSPDVGGQGPISSKANALRHAHHALVIENFAGGSQYVTEKLWDALLCWCVPLYYGSTAIDGLIPPESFIRIPSLDDRGVAVVREALADQDGWKRRVDAIAEARRRALGELRMVEWLTRELKTR